MVTTNKNDKKLADLKIRTETLLKLPSSSKADSKKFDKELKKLLSEYTKNISVFKLSQSGLPDFFSELINSQRLNRTFIEQLNDIVAEIGNKTVVDKKDTGNSSSLSLADISDILDEKRKEEALLSLLYSGEDNNLSILLLLYRIYIKRKNIKEIVELFYKFIHMGFVYQIKNKFIYDTLVICFGMPETNSLGLFLELLREIYDKTADSFILGTIFQIQYFLLNEKIDQCPSDSLFYILLLTDSCRYSEAAEFFSVNLSRFTKAVENSFGSFDFSVQILKQFCSKTLNYSLQSCDGDYFTDSQLALSIYKGSELLFNFDRSLSLFYYMSIVLLSIVTNNTNIRFDEIYQSVNFKNFLESFVHFQDNVFLLKSKNPQDEIYRAFFYANLQENIVATAILKEISVDILAE